jgi:ubiquinone/menaquinone biosynthesis C-methylase UbiE
MEIKMFDKIAEKQFKIIDGIAYFVSDQECENNIEWAKELIDGNYTESNWDSVYNSKNNNDILDEIGKNISKKNCLILEIGTGPGGGFFPHILKADTDADIIISDLSPTVIREWKRLFSKKIFPPKIKYAVFDICDNPLRNESIDIVTSIYGFANLVGDQRKGLSEVYRVIKKEGIFINCDLVIDNECQKTMSLKTLNKINEHFEYMFKDFYQETIDVGFKIIENKIINSWTNENDESTLASLCRELGIVLKFNTYIRYCVK